jgi:hypothetical protein
MTIEPPRREKELPKKILRGIKPSICKKYGTHTHTHTHTLFAGAT